MAHIQANPDLQRSALKITEVETIPLRVPFAQPFKISKGKSNFSINGPRRDISGIVRRCAGAA